MRSFLGWVTLLLLAVAAVLVMARPSSVASWLSGPAPADSVGGSGGVLDPRVQPFQTPPPPSGSPAADQMIRDVEAMGSVSTP